MLRKIRRNITEAATGKRLNRYGSNHTLSFKSRRAEVAAFITSRFSVHEYLKHKTHQRNLATEKGE